MSLLLHKKLYVCLFINVVKILRITGWSVMDLKVSGAASGFLDQYSDSPLRWEVMIIPAMDDDFCNGTVF